MPLDEKLTNALISELDRMEPAQIYGKVTSIKGLVVESSGLEMLLSLGSRCRIFARDGREVVAEVVGFRENRALLMPYGSLEGVGLGSEVSIESHEAAVYPSESWMGRVINGFAEPIDGKGLLPVGIEAIPLMNKAPAANKRKRIGGKIDLGVRSLNTFLTCCEGQRMGIFSGSGVGKSTMLSMIARYSTADVNIIGLVGERGREVQEFLEDDLGELGLKRSVVIVATSDEPALMRKQAANLTLSVSEYFRNKGLKVLCLIDSITRYAMALREIGLSAGEPPTTKGYTPSVFAELPKLLERAGPGEGQQGSITGLFSVLVEGDDTNEPISDAVRGIVDGHIVLERQIAERGRYPAVNILKSISRTMPECNNATQNQIIKRARRILSIYDDMAEMIRLGAYRRGSDKEVDEAINFFPLIENFLSQGHEEKSDLETGYGQLAQLLGFSYP